MIAYGNSLKSEIVNVTACRYCHAEIGERCYKNHHHIDKPPGPFWPADAPHMDRIKAYNRWRHEQGIVSTRIGY